MLPVLEVERRRAGDGGAVGVAAADLQRAGALVGDGALDAMLELACRDVVEQRAHGFAAAQDERVAPGPWSRFWTSITASGA